MNRPPYAFREGPPTIVNSGSVVSDNGPSVLPSNSMAGTQQGQYTMPGTFRQM